MDCAGEGEVATGYVLPSSPSPLLNPSLLQSALVCGGQEPLLTCQLHQCELGGRGAHP